MTENKDIPRLAISAFILVLFGYVVIRHYSVGIEETVKAIVLLAVGYWLGSSKGSADKSTALAKLSAGPNEVEVINDPRNPVPVDPHA